jgi:hypothetical protein
LKIEPFFIFEEKNGGCYGGQKIAFNSGLFGFSPFNFNLSSARMG